jgi:hypothetical protein
MRNKVNASFSVQSWSEKTWNGEDAGKIAGRKRTHAVVGYTYDGEIVGESTVHYLMSYDEDGGAMITGLEHFSGTVRGKQGTFVSRLNGTYHDGTVRGTMEVHAGSGTGDLVGLSGRADVEIVGEKPAYQLVLEYEIR